MRTGAVKKPEWIFDGFPCRPKLSLRARKGAAISRDQVRYATPYQEIPTGHFPSE